MSSLHQRAQFCVVGSNTRTPVRVGFVSLGVNIGLNITVVAPLVYFDKLAAPHAFLALSTGISACTNAFLLHRGLRRAGVLKPGAGWARLLVRVTVASALMAVALWWLAGDLDRWLAMRTWERAWQTLVCVIAGAAAYFAALFAVGARPADLRP